jgi:MFS family permease
VSQQFRPRAQQVRLAITPAFLIDYLSSVTSFERNVKLVLAGTMARGLAIGLLGTIFNLYLYSLGFSRPFIGIVNGVQALATLLVGLPLGYAADHWGRKPVLVAGGIAYPLATIGLTLTRIPALLLVLTFSFGVAATAYWVAAVPTLIANSEQKEWVRIFSVNSFLLWGIGPFGALLGGGVAQLAAVVLHVSSSSSSALRIALYFMTLIGSLGAIPFFFIRESRSPVVKRSTDTEKSPIGLFIRLMVPDAALAMGAGSVLTFIQLYFHLRFSLVPGTIGLVMAGGGIAGGLATLVAPALAHRWGTLGTVLRLQCISGPLMLILALVPWVALAILCYWALMASARMTDPIYTTFAQGQVPDTLRARLAGIYNVTYAIGFGLGPTISGFLQSYGGFTLAFIYGMGCYLLGATLLFIFFGRPSVRRAATSDQRVDVSSQR